MQKVTINKKKWLRRLVYCVVVFVTAGFAFYQYKQSQKEILLAEKKDLIFPSLELSQIESFSLEKNDTKVHVFRKAEDWYLDSPVKDIADADLTKDWLENLLTEKIRPLQEKGVDWKEYNLHDRVRALEIKKRSKETLKLRISNYSAFDGKFYIKKGEKLLLGNVSWASLTNKDGDYFRSYKLLNKKEHPTGIVYTSNLFKTQLKFDHYKWQWDNKDQTSLFENNFSEGDKKKPEEKSIEDTSSLFPLSQSDLESYWSNLLKVNLVKESYPNTEKFRKKYKLSTPAIELELKFKENKSWFVKISPEINNKFYALISTREYIFALNKDEREKILLTEKIIRDHRQPFQFKKDQVYSMELKGYGLDVQLKKEKEKWVLFSKSDTDEAVEQNKIKNVEHLQSKREKEQEISDSKGKEGAELKTEKSVPTSDLAVGAKKNPNGKTAYKSEETELNLGELENIFNRIPVLSAKEYFPQKKFQKTAYVILKNQENQPILKLEFSDPFKKSSTKSGEQNKQFVYAVSSIGKEVMTLDFSALKFVFSSDLLRSVSQKKK